MPSARAHLGGSNAATGPPSARSGASLPDPCALHLLYPIWRRPTYHDLHHGAPVARPLPPLHVLEGDAPPAHRATRRNRAKVYPGHLCVQPAYPGSLQLFVIGYFRNIL
uniref:Uncharacterized protein n=1 Tax=Triticum urartu TaxID=4572 RepID=A0A8R7QRX8_TRIUA